jgi:hypothetical protein
LDWHVGRKSSNTNLGLLLAETLGNPLGDRWRRRKRRVLPDTVRTNEGERKKKKRKQKKEEKKMPDGEPMEASLRQRG